MVEQAGRFVVVGRFVTPLRKNAKGAMMLGSGGFTAFTRPREPAHGMAAWKQGLDFLFFAKSKRS